ncbi:MAG: cupin domain-containing protein [Candidatus Omnitrophica bacterium]|nr:cupin domain-containing protein [Candidatus Omnitrophota bacterium]
MEIKKLTDEEVAQLGINNWPIWQKEESTFDWHYDQKEECLFLEGEVVVQTDNESVKICKGDFVSFPQGLSCKWIVKKKVKKHYKFS